MYVSQPLWSYPILVYLVDPRTLTPFHQTVLSLEVHLGYRMHCTSEKLISNEQHGHKKCSMNKLSYGIFVEMILDVTRQK